MYLLSTDVILERPNDLFFLIQTRSYTKTFLRSYTLDLGSLGIDLYTGSRAI